MSKKNLIEILNKISNNETNYEVTNIDQDGKINLNQSEVVDLKLNLDFFKKYFI